RTRNALLGVAQRRMPRRNAAVDDADHDVLAAQAEVGAQTAGLLLEPQEDRAVVRRDVLIAVGPDALDLVALRELRGLRGRELRREAVQREPIAVDLAARRANGREQPIVALLELTRVALHRA